MLLKKISTLSFGVLLSLKAMAGYKELYSADLAQVEHIKKRSSDEQFNYKISTHYRIDDHFAFDAGAIGTPGTAIFGSRIAPAKLQSLLDLPLNDTYRFTSTLAISSSSLT